MMLVICLNLTQEVDHELFLYFVNHFSATALRCCDHRILHHIYSESLILSK